VVTDVGELVPAVLERVAAGERLKEAAAAVAAAAGANKRELYNAAAGLSSQTGDVRRAGAHRGPAPPRS
jgi:hypothetical protein